VITQPIALLLAEKLEQQFPLGTAQHYLDGEAAAELRRLSAQTDNDTALLRQALEALETFQKISDFTPAQGVHAITALRERLGEKT
jgi:hypothetical protein